MSKKSNYKKNDGRKDVKKEVKKGKNFRPRRDDRDDFAEPTGTTRRGGNNDIAWYAKNPSILRDSASLSFNNPLGETVRTYVNEMWSFPTSNGASIKDVSSLRLTSVESIPGLMSLHLHMGPGHNAFEAGDLDAVNTSMLNIYAWVRHMNSGSKNYDAPDLMLYLLAMDNLYTFFAFCKRAYGLLPKFTQRNRYMPKVYFKAMNLDYNDFMSKIADFRAFINQMAAELTSFCVPATMPLFLRHSWLMSNVYLDAPSEKAQQYLFVNDHFYEYNETGSPNGGYLDPKHIFTPTRDSLTGWTDKTLDDLKSIFRSMMNAVIKSEDIGIMSGDILKAYGQDKLFKLDPITPEYSVEPVYNEEVLSQIHNAFVGMYNTSVTTAASLVTNRRLRFPIKQNPNTGNLQSNLLVYSCSTGSNNNAGVQAITGNIIDFKHDGASPEDVMIASRFMISTVQMAPEGADSDFIMSGVKYSGTEIIDYACVWERWVSDAGQELFSPNYIGSFNYLTFTGSSASISAPRNNLAAQVKGIGLVAQFDWAPLNYWFIVTYASAGSSPATHTRTYDVFLPANDLCNYTLLRDQELYKLHNTAILSELDVPVLGSF